MLQTILGLTASEFASDSSNTAAVTAAIVSSFQAPANISAGQVRGLLLLDAHAADRGQQKKKQLKQEEEEFVGSWALVAISYDIVTESRYPSEAFSSQLRGAVASGAFSRSLQLFAARLGATHLRNATSPAVSVGKPEQGKGKERKGSSSPLFSSLADIHIHIQALLLPPGDATPSQSPTAAAAAGPASASSSQGAAPLSVGFWAGTAAAALALSILCGAALVHCTPCRRSCCGGCGGGGEGGGGRGQASPRRASRGRISYMQFSTYDARIESSAVFDDAII
jgi:hypothetical protein